MDLNFDFGNILSKDTKIISIWKYKGSPVIDGKIDDTVSLTDLYSIKFKVGGSTTSLIQIKDNISGSLRLNNYKITFNKLLNGDGHEVSVFDITKGKPRKRDPSYGDISNWDETQAEKKLKILL